MDSKKIKIYNMKESCIEEFNLDTEEDINVFLTKIKRHICDNIKGIYLTDTSAIGIYKKPTIYIWVYIGMKEKVISEVNKLYPGIFELHDPTNRFNDKDMLKDKIILKINQTSVNMPILPKEEKKKTCIIF